MKNITIRAISGAVYIGLIIGSLLYNKSAFAAVIFLFNTISLVEYQNLNSNKHKDFSPLVSGTFLFLIAHLYVEEIMPFKGTVLILLIPLILLVRDLFSNPDKQKPSTSHVLFSLFYITVPLLTLDYLNFSAANQYSRMVVAIFILVWSNDTFAFLSGKVLGKHKIFERISPKKTWEGTIGGIFTTIAIAWLLFRWVGFYSLPAWLILAFLVSVSAIIGDFIESMLKRNAGVKDSGKIMPGHGGILDRIDSLLFVFPVVLIYIQIISI